MLSDILKKRAECNDKQKSYYLLHESEYDNQEYLNYESEFDDFISSSWTENQNAILIDFSYPLSETDSEITWILLTEFRGRSILERLQYWDNELKTREEMQLNLCAKFSKYYSQLFENHLFSISNDLGNICFGSEVATIWYKFNGSAVQRTTCFFGNMNTADSRKTLEAVKYLCYSSRLRLFFVYFFSRFITG